MDAVQIYDSRKFLMELAWKHLLLPYRWAGDDPGAGFDCSGLIVELLQSVGALEQNVDLNSQGLFDLYGKYRCDAKPGALVFFGRSHKTIRHVALCVGRFHCIEAAGGDSTTNTTGDAIQQNAFVRMRPISWPGWREPLAFADPFVMFQA